LTQQEIRDIEKIDLLNKALDMKNAGYRLAQICATKPGRAGGQDAAGPGAEQVSVVLLYSFVKGNELVTLRFPTDTAEPVESISWLYAYAFLYENELKDLFGLNILNMNLDFNGHLYCTSIKTPFVNRAESEVAANE
jgi:ech hydrogenase subunit D